MKNQSLLLLMIFLLIGKLHLHATDTTNLTVASLNAWEIISNQWSSVPLSQAKQAAGQSNVAAQYYLGRIYSGGIRVAQDEGEAFKWMQAAAQQGMARAQLRLGWMFQDGAGTAKSASEAVEWFRKAAEQSDSDAQMNLGWAYEHGAGVLQDYVEAAKFYRQAAEQGNAMAQNNLGWLYKNGWGLPQDATEAFKWFQKSADQGEALGEENLAWIHAKGAYGPTEIINYGPGALLRTGGIAPNHDLAEKWMRQAVDPNTMEGEYKLGNLIYNEMVIRTNEQQESLEQDETRSPAAAEWLKKAAEQGHAQAQYQLADMYISGKLGDDQRSNCIPWFLKAAAQGNVEAKAKVGDLPELYPNNELLKSVNNIEILRQSGEQGNLEAQYQLAKRYQFGIGVPKDPLEAFKWMQKAAHNDTASSVIGDAIYSLAVMYEKGEGVAADVEEAHKLFLEAAGPVFRQRGAAFRVGQMYEKGNGMPQDDHTAMKFYCNNVHDVDHPEYAVGYNPGDGAVESLLNLWAQGRGFPNEKDKAENDYREPSRLIKYWTGSMVTAKAEYDVGQIYLQGKLVPQDLVEAAARFRIAANQNLDNAQKMLDKVESEMSAEQKETEKIRFDDLGKIFEQAKKDAEAIKEGRDYVPWGAPL